MNTHTHEYSGLHISVHAYTHTQYRIVYSSPLHTYTCGCMYVQRNNTEYSSHTYMHRHTNRIANMNAGMFTHTPYTHTQVLEGVELSSFRASHVVTAFSRESSCLVANTDAVFMEIILHSTQPGQSVAHHSFMTVFFFPFSSVCVT